MASLDLTLLVLAAAAAVAWSAMAASRLAVGRVAAVARGLLGGGAAFGLAASGYGLLSALGREVTWEQVAGGGWTAFGAALLIGLVEEGAKVGGLALAVREPRRPAEVMTTAIGTCAAFAALETVAVFSGGPPALGVARALLAPVAHALLTLPASFGVALAARRGRRTGLVAVPISLALSVALHAFGNLALASPRYGRLGYATALLLPLLAVWFHLRRPGAAGSTVPRAAPLSLPLPLPVPVAVQVAAPARREDAAGHR